MNDLNETLWDIVASNQDFCAKLRQARNNYSKRQKKIDVIADSFDPIEPFGDSSGKLLVLGWGGTYGAIRSAVQRARVEGKSVSHIHIRNLNPLPKDLGEMHR